jgi:diaminopimelate decarboxylase
MLRKAAKAVVLHALNAYDKREAAPLALSHSLWDMTVSDDGDLCWEGCSLPELARRYGTPLHVISRARLERNYRDFLGAFTALYPKVEIGYSYKTNPLPGVIQALHDVGACAEVISHFELWLALSLGVAPERIILNGPGKTDDALELAVCRGIRLINIDNLDEIATIERLAAKYGRAQQVGVRVVTSVGWSSQFGLHIASGAALDAFRRIHASPSLIPCALHAHLGTGIRDTEVYFTAVAEMLAFARELKSDLGVQLRYLDFGGGFGVPTVRPLSRLDTRLLANGFPVKPPRPGHAPSPARYAEGIVNRLGRYYDLSAPDAPGLLLEPGRAITSSAQCLLVSVLALKAGDRSSEYAIVDGGRNISMPLGYEYHEAFVANRAKLPPSRRYSVFGPLCHPGDVLFRFRDFPALRRGDVFAVMDAGAYFIPNQMNFSNPRPAVVMVSKGESRLVRKREGFEDIVRLDVP